MQHESSPTHLYASPDTLRSVLKKYGVAVIPQVLDEEECDEMIVSMWDYLEHVSQRFDTPIDRDDSETWREIRQLLPLHSMLIQHWGVGHSQFAWNVRQNRKILDIFAKLWKTKRRDLLVSFDGASFHMPPEVTGIGWYRGNEWLHTDQNLGKNDFQCVQSWVTAYDVNPGDATLVVLERSHKFHGEFGVGKSTKGDWYKLAEGEKEFFTSRGCVQREITCPAGSMVFWDSRTIHCGKEASKGRPEQNIRCVAYLCYTPRELATKKMIEKRIKAFENLRTTNHCPHQPKLFAKNPRTYGRSLPNVTEVPTPELRKIGRRLVGYEE